MSDRVAIQLRGGSRSVGLVQAAAEPHHRAWDAQGGEVPPQRTGSRQVR